MLLKQNLYGQCSFIVHRSLSKSACNGQDGAAKIICGGCLPALPAAALELPPDVLPAPAPSRIQIPFMTCEKGEAIPLPFAWSEWRDLNPRPLGPEPSTLPSALHPDAELLLRAHNTSRCCSQHKAHIIYSSFLALSTQKHTLCVVIMRYSAVSTCNGP